MDRFAHGGEGIANGDDGRVHFVPGAFPGELVDAVEVQHKSRWSRVADVVILEPSAVRRAPTCPVAARCGGCPWMALEDDAQRQARRDVARGTLEHVGGLGSDTVEMPIHGAAALGFRVRVRLHHDGSGRVGFHRHGTHEVVPIDHCAVADPRLAPVIAALPKILGDSSGRAVHTVDLRVDDRGAINIGLGAATRPAAAMVAALERFGSVVPLGGAGERQHFDLPGGVTLRPSPGAFVQVNREVNQLLVGAVVDGARARGAQTFVDLYCGAGNFSLSLAAHGLSGRGYEGSALAVDDASYAADRAGLGAKVRFEAQDLDALPPALPAAPDLLVVDPPRAGAPGLGRWVEQLRPEHIALVSCDPATLGRDVRALRALGCVIESAAAFDMFPQTPHVETLVWLRGPGPS